MLCLSHTLLLLKEAFFSLHPASQLSVYCGGSAEAVLSASGSCSDWKGASVLLHSECQTVLRLHSPFISIPSSSPSCSLPCLIPPIQGATVELETEKGRLSSFNSCLLSLLFPPCTTGKSLVHLPDKTIIDTTIFSRANKSWSYSLSRQGKCCSPWRSCGLCWTCCSLSKSFLYQGSQNWMLFQMWS